MENVLAHIPPQELGSQTDVEQEPAPSGKKQRAKSAIQFPYGDLDSAVEVVKAIHPRGNECRLAQLAVWMGHEDVDSGAFRSRLATARIFGLIEVGGGAVTLTPLGRSLADPSREEDARVNAFLTVPLYRGIFEQYDGYMLPKDIGLENDIVRLGVPPKQKVKARQALQRSAEQAGLFEAGKEHLVLPSGYGKATTRPVPDGTSSPSQGPKTDQRRGQDGDGSDVALPEVPPAIRGLLSLLPKPGAKWSPMQQDRWVGALVQVLDFIYKADEVNDLPARIQPLQKQDETRNGID